MSPRIAYWTTSFVPEMEAIAAEVALLRRNFPRSVIWGVSSRDGNRLHWTKGFAVSPRFQIPFRLITAVAQHAFHINHLIGGLGDWFHLRSLTKRPTVLTLAVNAPAACRELLGRVDRYVVEWPAAIANLSLLGVNADRVDVIYPSVDIDKFTPRPRPDGPFTVLFASSPDRKDWLTARGVDALLDTAALCPQMRFRLLWRPWGDSADEVRRWIQRRDCRNVELVTGIVTDMAEQYSAAHVTVVPFRDSAKCKPVPNSVLESLASGRPVVVTPIVGVERLICESRAGRTASPDGTSLAESLRRIKAEWPKYSHNARDLAVACFSTTRFVESYRKVYSKVL